jgi:hypothetical protein
MPRVDTQIIINRTPDDLFAVITDLERSPEWLSAIVGVTDLSIRPPVVGATFTEKARFMAKEIETPKVVTGYDPPRFFAHASTGGPVPQELSITLAPHAEGTELSLTFEAEPGGFFGALPVPILVMAMRVLLSENLAVLKKKMEQEDVAQS